MANTASNGKASPVGKCNLRRGFPKRVQAFRLRLRPANTASNGEASPVGKRHLTDRAPAEDASCNEININPRNRHFAYGFARRILHPTVRLRWEGIASHVEALPRGLRHLAYRLRRVGTASNGEASPIGKRHNADRVPAEDASCEEKAYCLAASPGEYCIQRRGFAKRVQAFRLRLRMANTASNGKASPIGKRHNADRVPAEDASCEEININPRNRHFAYGFARRILHPTVRLRWEGIASHVEALPRGLRHLAYRLRRVGTASNGEASPIGKRHNADRVPAEDASCEEKAYCLAASLGGNCIQRQGIAKRVQAFRLRLRMANTASNGKASPVGKCNLRRGFPRRFKIYCIFTCLDGRISMGHLVGVW